MEDAEIQVDVMPKRTIAVYIILLVISVVAALLGVHYHSIGDLILIIPIILILIDAIVRDQHVIHIPPFIVVLMVLTFFIAYLGQGLRSSEQIGFVASILQGINLELIGLVCLYALMSSTPTRMNDNPMVILISECVAIAIYTVMMVVQYYVSQFWDPMGEVELALMMEQMLGVFVGSLLIGSLFAIDSTHRFFEYTLNTFMRGKSREVTATEKVRQDAIRMMRTGETDRVEFKSTLRTNLETGEKDKRMEKAVLKTLVAFLNTEGGTLLVGVDDKGTPLGLDSDQFENEDKMNLHFTHMISNGIGDEFLPYIWFALVDIEGKTIMVVNCDKCKKPVFFKDGKTEEFYVRSGPSSIVLTGKSLVNYVSNRSKKSREKVLDEVSLIKNQRWDGGRSLPFGREKFAGGSFVLALGCFEGLLRFPDGPCDQQGHDDGEDGDDDGIHGQTEEIILGTEDAGDGLFYCLVPCQCRNESESRGDQGREGLEQLNLELVRFS